MSLFGPSNHTISLDPYHNMAKAPQEVDTRRWHVTVRQVDNGYVVNVGPGTYVAEDIDQVLNVIKLGLVKLTINDA